VKDECLVYLIHEAGLADDDARFSALTRQLLGRCTPTVTRNLRNLGVAAPDVEDALSDVVSEMISAILSEDGKGDFYQVRFGKALRSRILKVHARYSRRQKRARREVAFGGNPKGEAENEEAVPLEERVAAPGDIADDFENRLLIRGALAAIKDSRHREAFVLQNYDGWQVESIDPLEPTISGHFGKTARTIRTWISTAERDVAEWRAAQLRDEELPT
jgi:DNA-directed RNA polymerase specialized sigma24 family protein